MMEPRELFLPVLASHQTYSFNLYIVSTLNFAHVRLNIVSGDSEWSIPLIHALLRPGIVALGLASGP
jgi:hypothetical protein